MCESGWFYFKGLGHLKDLYLNEEPVEDVLH